MFVDSKVFYILFSWKICQVWLDGYSYFYREFLIFENDIVSLLTLLVLTSEMAEAYSEDPCQTWRKPLTIFAKSSALDVEHSSEYAYESSVYLRY